MARKAVESEKAPTVVSLLAPHGATGTIDCAISIDDNGATSPRKEQVNMDVGPVLYILIIILVILAIIYLFQRTR
jgi:hypothetical protein